MLALSLTSIARLYHCLFNRSLELKMWVDSTCGNLKPWGWRNLVMLFYFVKEFCIFCEDSNFCWLTYWCSLSLFFLVRSYSRHVSLNEEVFNSFFSLIISSLRFELIWTDDLASALFKLNLLSSCISCFSFLCLLVVPHCLYVLS